MFLSNKLRLSVAGFVVSTSLLAFAAQPWAKDQSRWTASDVDRILGSSPWAQTTEAIFGVKGGDEQDPNAAVIPSSATTTMAGRRGITDGNWDGGVGRMPRGSTPSLRVAIRWESALPIRQALAKSESVKGSPFADRGSKEYILSVEGLLAATKASSSDAIDSQRGDSQRMLEGLMTTSRMTLRGRVIRPDDAKIEASTGELYLFFPRTEPIVEKDKEVRFDARYGSLSVSKVFKLKDMMYKGQLEL